MLWWKYCSILKYSYGVEDTFLTSFGFEEQSVSETAIAMSYFMFTSLSTVGLGDYHPTNSQERVLGIFLLFFGVLVTSTVIESLTTMAKKHYEATNQHS